MRRATRAQGIDFPRGFNSRPSCDGRPSLAETKSPNGVSIHARRATGDRWARRSAKSLSGFNSRPSCDGRRLRFCNPFAIRRFNLRPSCDGRPEGGGVFGRELVSIHARRATGDKIQGAQALKVFTFQFTPVVRRATPLGLGRFHRTVSIHARRATGDRLAISPVGAAMVSIHARRATGDSWQGNSNNMGVFQFTPVVRRATRLPGLWGGWMLRFNSRPSCDGRPRCRSTLPKKELCFNSRPSCDGRPCGRTSSRRGTVSIHARRATGDCARR